MITPAAPALLVDRYVVLGELAQGGMGVVYRARDPQLSREVALKLLRPERAERETVLVRFEREAQLLAAVRHKHLVAVHAAGSWQGRPYLVMDLIQGEALSARLKRGERTPPCEAAELVRKIASGLAVLHANGIVHRDVKPHNVIVDAAGEPVLVDFGLALDLDRATRLTGSRELVGTPLFMAPEQTRGKKSAVGPATDVWGLGVVLWALLTGRTPFRAENLPELLALINSRRAPPLREHAPEVDPELERIVLRCLEKSPARRWPDAGALAEALAGWTARGSAPRRRPRSRLRPVLAGAATAAALVLLMGSAWIAGAAVREPAEPSAALALAPESGLLAPVTSGPPAQGAPADLAEAERAFREGRHAEVERLLASPGAEARAWLLRARTRAAHGAVGPAIEDAGRALQLDAGLVEAWRLRAELRWDRGALREAVQDLQRAAQLQPGKETLRQLASRARMVGQLELAQESVEQAIQRAPDDAALRALRRLITDDLELLAEAERIRARPGDGRLRARLLGRLHDRAHGSLQESPDCAGLAVRLASRVLQLDPGHSRALEVRAIGHLVLGMAAEARADAELLSVFEPTDEDGPIIRARARMALGEGREGLAALKAWMRDRCKPTQVERLRVTVDMLEKELAGG